MNGSNVADVGTERSVAGRGGSVDADEDTFRMPEDWRRHIHPRRDHGYLPPGGTKSGARRGARDLTACLGGVAWDSDVDGDPDIAAAAREFLAAGFDGKPAAGTPAGGSPVGAAAVAHAVMHATRWADRAPSMTVFADAWAVARGVVFAAQTVVELVNVETAGFRAHGSGSASALMVDACGFRRPAADDPTSWLVAVEAFAMAARVRALLATARPEHYQAAIEALSAYREGLPAQRMLTSFLLPTQAAWVDEDCAMVADVPDARPLPLVCAIGSAAQLGQIADHPNVLSHGPSYQHRRFADNAMPALVTVAAALGGDAAATFVFWHDHRCAWVDRHRVLSALAELPGDEAFQALLERVREDSATILAGAVRRFPARALRLMAAVDPADRPVVDQALRSHVGANPELVDIVSPTLDDDAAQRVRAIQAEGGSSPHVAPADRLPHILVVPPWRRADAASSAAAWARPPALPVWADPAVLPQVALRDAAGVLPADSVRHLCGMLALSQPASPCPGVVEAREVCEPRDLGEFGWALFERWLGAGHPAKQRWAFVNLCLTADDEIVSRLVTRIEKWSATMYHQRATVACQVLADVGTDSAARALHGIATRVKRKVVRDRAAYLLNEVARRLNLSREELLCRMMPDLGAAAAGTLVLDYGPRAFTVRLDERLTPGVTDRDGRPLKALPKPGARDDQELAPAAYQRFATLKKDLRTVGTERIAQLEYSMVSGRRWDVDGFAAALAADPLLWQLARRVVWGGYDTGGELRATFRVAEDRTFADVDDAPWSLRDGVRAGMVAVGVTHPVHLAAHALRVWAAVFSDYQVLQPFEQLVRAVHRLTDDEAPAEALTRFAGTTLPTGKLLGLERRGWRRGSPQDNGIQQWMERPVAGGGVVTMAMDPGIVVGSPMMFPEQKLGDVVIGPRYLGWRATERRAPLSELGPVDVSEILRDLTEALA